MAAPKQVLVTAIHLFPKTRNVLCIYDQTVTGLAHQEAFKRLLPELPSIKVEFYNFSAFTIEETLGRLKSLPEDTVVMALSFSQEKSGNMIPLHEALRILPTAAVRPIFVATDNRVSGGAFGGKVLRGFDQGEAAAQMLLDLIHGKSASELPVRKSLPGKYVFSDRALHRFGISESQLPKPCVIQGREVSFLREHSTLVAATALALLILLGLVSILWINLARLRKTQAALKESEAMFRILFEHSAVGSAQTDPRTGRYLRVNNRLCRILGRSQEEMLRMTYAEVTHPDDLAYDLERVRRMMQGEIREYTRQKRYIHKNGSMVWASLSVSAFGTNGGAPEWFITVVQDITALKEAEEQLIQSERLSAVGQLSAGIAHEFNNMLMIILGYTDLLKTQHGALQDVSDGCDIISTQVVRGRDIVSQMMRLANPSPLQKGVVRINELIKEVLQAQAGPLDAEQIEVVRDCGADVAIRGDHRQLHQVLTSLIVNARHAIRAKGSGTITIKAALTESHLELSVIDTGTGISEEAQKKMFTPFFTTKGGFATNDLGIKGSGLALCVCLRIVQLHNGKITFESTEGKGTRFTVLLPATAVAIESQPARSAVVAGPQRAPRLLVVDDESAICNILRQMLRNLGNPLVDTASSGLEALEKMKTQTYDIAFVDLMMPEMGGLDLLKAIQRKGAQTRFVFVSGQLDVTEDELVQQGASALLYKPFNVGELKQILQRVLETISSTPPTVS